MTRFPPPVTFRSREQVGGIALAPIADFLSHLHEARHLIKLADILQRYRTPKSYHRYDFRIVDSSELPPSPGAAEGDEDLGNLWERERERERGSPIILDDEGEGQPPAVALASVDESPSQTTLREGSASNEQERPEEGATMGTEDAPARPDAHVQDQVVATRQDTAPPPSGQGEATNTFPPCDGVAAAREAEPTASPSGDLPSDSHPSIRSQLPSGPSPPDSTLLLTVSDTLFDETSSRSPYGHVATTARASGDGSTPQPAINRQTVTSSGVSSALPSVALILGTTTTLLSDASASLALVSPPPSLRDTPHLIRDTPLVSEAAVAIASGASQPPADSSTANEDKTDGPAGDDENENPESRSPSPFTPAYPPPPGGSFHCVRELRLDIRTLDVAAIFELEVWRREVLSLDPLDQIVPDSKWYQAPKPKPSQGPKRIEPEVVDLRSSQSRTPTPDRIVPNAPDDDTEIDPDFEPPLSVRREQAGGRPSGRGRGRGRGRRRGGRSSFYSSVPSDQDKGPESMATEPIVADGGEPGPLTQPCARGRPRGRLRGSRALLSSRPVTDIEADTRSLMTVDADFAGSEYGRRPTDPTVLNPRGRPRGRPRGSRARPSGGTRPQSQVHERISASDVQLDIHGSSPPRPRPRGRPRGRPWGSGRGGLRDLGPQPAVEDSTSHFVPDLLGPGPTDNAQSPVTVNPTPSISTNIGHHYTTGDEMNVINRRDSVASFVTAAEDAQPDAMDVDFDFDSPWASHSRRLGLPPSGTRADSPICIDTAPASPERRRFGKRRWDVESTPSREIFAESLFSPSPEPPGPPESLPKLLKFTPRTPRQILDCVEIPVRRRRPGQAHTPLRLEPSTQSPAPITKPRAPPRTNTPSSLVDRSTSSSSKVLPPVAEARGPRRMSRRADAPVLATDAVVSAPPAKPDVETPPVASWSHRVSRTTSFVQLPASPASTSAPLGGSSITPPQVREWMEPTHAVGSHVTGDDDDNGRFADADEEWGAFKGM